MQVPEEIRSIVDHLKRRSIEDIEKTFQYWHTLYATAPAVDSLEHFYNNKIRIQNSSRKNSSSENTLKFENVTDLFHDPNDTRSRRKRLFITGPAGYGKSVFVHEMVRRWATTDSSILFEKDDEFWFVFLFRLSEISCDDESLESLMSKYFDHSTVDKVMKILEQNSYLEKTLFIFDGLYEVLYKLSKNLQDLMHNCSTPYIIITKRSDENAGHSHENLNDNKNSITLNGFTDQGAVFQLEKFSIDITGLSTDHCFMNLMKVPLFNTLYAVIQSRYSAFGGSSPSINRCALIDRYVNCLIDRHRPLLTSSNGDKTCESELLLVLGQAAQFQFGEISFKRSVDPIVACPDFNREFSHHYRLAKSIGLISINSRPDKLIFPHKTFADYFAAYYWSKKIDNNLPIQKISNCKVHFSQPIDGGTCFTRCWFSYFLSHFSAAYKNAIWTLSAEPPLLVDYESLPIKKLSGEEPQISFTREMDCREINYILNKLDFDFDLENYMIELSLVGFEPGSTTFSRLTTLKRLKLYRCFIHQSPRTFFSVYNLTELKITCCSWEYSSQSTTEVSSGELKLEKLSVYNHEGEDAKFLTEILNECSNLKELILVTINDFDWLNALPQGKALKHITLISSILTQSSALTLINVLPLLNLEKLEFSDVKGIDRIDFLTVINSSTGLRNIRFDNKCDINFRAAERLLTNFRCSSSSWELYCERT